VGGLANSIFQGNILISEKSFLEKYPSQSGYRLLLIDVNKKDNEKVAQELNWSLQDLGIDLVSTTERLASFNQVENTYLAIFLILGGLGMILGTVGLGIVILRTIGERRGELALLRALGYEPHLLHRLLLYENGVLLVAGILCGAISALIAALPAILSPGIDMPYGMVVMLFFGIVLSGAFWTYFAIRLAIRGDLLPALRNE
jgi:ABC-type antimicrobial peptide transport system permease subunit